MLPDARVAASTPITVSPAPVTSYFLGLGQHAAADAPAANSVILLRARHQQRRQFEFGDELHAALNDLRFITALAHHRFKLREVQGEQRRAAIAFKSVPFGSISFLLPASRASRIMVWTLVSAPFGIVRKDQRANRAQRLLNALVHRLRIDAGEALFKVEADQLLIARQYTSLVIVG